MATDLHALSDALEDIRNKMLAAEAQRRDTLRFVHHSQRKSAANLLHYLVLRREDLRDIQHDLHNAGLSSLASSESHALFQVESVLERLGAIHTPRSDGYDYPAAARLLGQRAAALFGAKRNLNIPHVMVTFESSLADDYAGVKALLEAGMNVARINCAHDKQPVWLQMIENIRKATRATGLSCKIYLDLAGPKIRTEILGKGRNKDRIKLNKNERFLLVEPDAIFDRNAKVVGCTQPGVVRDLECGDRVLFDDGLIETVVEKIEGGAATLCVRRVPVQKTTLKAEKGINFPDTELSIRCLTDFDKIVLPFARKYADAVGFSFVRHPDEIAELQSLLHAEEGRRLPIVLKIETLDAVQNLPALLLQGMQEPLFGVMIARGDLAVEIGFERLSEIQEEILWICEAAHVPVIWATQVLETLNKSGIATRSEVTDAARAAHAECVMLNKGKYLLTVLATLRDILHRSGGHHLKKRYVFRPLNIAEQFLRKKAGPGKGRNKKK